MQFYKLRPEHKPGSRARLMRIEKELEAGFRFMEKFDEVQVVTMYGSARAKESEEHYENARNLAQKLGKQGIAVVTGGGPGIMEAANRGAYEVGGMSIGLGIHLDHLKEDPNNYMTDHMNFYYFFARKMILAHIAQAYVYFPGGFGTMDEFFKLATLIATKKLEQDPKVILVGKDYWDGLFHWLRHCSGGEKYHAVSEEELQKYIITDDVEEAYKMLTQIPVSIARSDAL